MLVLKFQAGDQRFALPATSVEHVSAYGEPRAVAGTPNWYAGLLVFRGMPTPIIDLCRLLTGSACAVRWNTRLIFLRPEGAADGRLIGLMVEQVTTATVNDDTTPEGDEPPREAGWSFRTLRGRVMLDEQGMFQLLDSNRLLQPEQAAFLAG